MLTYCFVNGAAWAWGGVRYDLLQRFSTGVVAGRGAAVVRVRAFLGGWCSGLPHFPARHHYVHGEPIWNINRGKAAWPGAIRVAGRADPPPPFQN